MFGVVVGVFDGVVGVEVWDDDLSDGIICSVLFGALFLSNFVVPRCLVLNGGLFGNRYFIFNDFLFSHWFFHDHFVTLAYVRKNELHLRAVRINHRT